MSRLFVEDFGVDFSLLRSCTLCLDCFFFLQPVIFDLELSWWFKFLLLSNFESLCLLGEPLKHLICLIKQKLGESWKCFGRWKSADG